MNFYLIIMANISNFGAAALGSPADDAEDFATKFRSSLISILQSIIT